jgi:exoribonuclease-2
VLERLDAPVEADNQDDEDDSEDEVAGPIAIAVDVNEAPDAGGDNPTP